MVIPRRSRLLLVLLGVAAAIGAVAALPGAASAQGGSDLAEGGGGSGAAACAATGYLVESAEERLVLRDELTDRPPNELGGTPLLSGQTWVIPEGRKPVVVLDSTAPMAGGTVYGSVAGQRFEAWSYAFNEPQHRLVTNVDFSYFGAAVRSLGMVVDGGPCEVVLVLSADRSVWSTAAGGLAVAVTALFGLLTVLVARLRTGGWLQRFGSAAPLGLVAGLGQAAVLLEAGVVSPVAAFPWWLPVAGVAVAALLPLTRWRRRPAAPALPGEPPAGPPADREADRQGRAALGGAVATHGAIGAAAAGYALGGGTAAEGTGGGSAGLGSAGGATGTSGASAGMGSAGGSGATIGAAAPASAPGTAAAATAGGATAGTAGAGAPAGPGAAATAGSSVTASGPLGPLVNVGVAVAAGAVVVAGTVLVGAPPAKAQAVVITPDQAHVIFVRTVDEARQGEDRHLGEGVLVSVEGLLDQDAALAGGALVAVAVGVPPDQYDYPAWFVASAQLEYEGGPAYLLSRFDRDSGGEPWLMTTFSWSTDDLGAPAVDPDGWLAPPPAAAGLVMEPAEVPARYAEWLVSSMAARDLADEALAVRSDETLLASGVRNFQELYEDGWLDQRMSVQSEVTPDPTRLAVVPLAGGGALVSFPAAGIQINYNRPGHTSGPCEAADYADWGPWEGRMYRLLVTEAPVQVLAWVPAAPDDPATPAPVLVEDRAGELAADLERSIPCQ